MTVTIQQGRSATIKLKFINPDGTIAPPPSSGGSAHADIGQQIGTANLSVDQQTVNYLARGLGMDTISYGGPDGLTATQAVHIVATTANVAVFDESTFIVLP